MSSPKIRDYETGQIIITKYHIHIHANIYKKLLMPHSKAHLQDIQHIVIYLNCLDSWLTDWFWKDLCLPCRHAQERGEGRRPPPRGGTPPQGEGRSPPRERGRSSPRWGQKSFPPEISLWTSQFFIPKYLPPKFSQIFLIINELLLFFHSQVSLSSDFSFFIILKLNLIH